MDRHGTLLCWGNLTHYGCSVQGCQRAHENLRGTFEQLDPCARMQLIKRGGLRRMKVETKESAEQKIKDLRAQVHADRAEKTKSKRKAGDGGEPGEQGNAETAKKAGGSGRVRFWEVPEEFEAVDYTKQEDVQDLIKAPIDDFGVPVPHQDRAHHGGEDRAPEEAKHLMEEAKKLESGPALSALNSHLMTCLLGQPLGLRRIPKFSWRHCWRRCSSMARRI